MGKRHEKVDAYLDTIPEYAQPILQHLRELIHTACPDVVEDWKWSFPVFAYNKAIMCNMAAFKNHCSFGFWKASLMKDEHHILNITEKETMGQLGKITTVADLPSDEVLIAYIHEAMQLNDAGAKVARPAKATEKEKAELTPPDYLTEALKDNEAARTVFEAFSYSHKKEYIQWLQEAKTEATRLKRLTQAIEMMAEGKDRNWKYKNC
jgi:uncharacterized protein YdeI (YjbR/CyaY-like superfamily)